MESFTIDSFKKPEFLEELGLVGKIPSTQCAASPEFSSCLYIPPRYRPLHTLPLMVLVHGSYRDNYKLRDKFTALADLHGCALICPLFPRVPTDPYDISNYKMVTYLDLRYDTILLSMIDEVVARYPRIMLEKFLLYGFSGGGQYVHRFAYLHPERLLGLAVGAPGTTTLPDEELYFPLGVRDLDRIFKIRPDWDAIKRVPSMFIAGDRDTGNLSATVRGRTTAVGSDGRYAPFYKNTSPYS
jgi:pimeloyl-ACP methyl ester carboxylesterase